MNRTAWAVTGVVLALAAAIGGYALWSHQQAPAALPTEAAAPSASAPAAPDESSTAAASAAPEAETHHAIEAPPGLPPLPPADKAEAFVNDRLIDLFGKPAVLSMLSSDHFVAHFVATVDNLGRESASSRVWPVVPTKERFLVETVDGQPVISPKNAERYTPLINLVDTMDTHSAVALYRHLYPLFQHQYEELGYPGKYFNDRLIVVIDHLLQAPTPAEPIKLVLTEVKGPVASTRPWVRYEFADPDLESRSAGQKIMMRVGAANEARIKAKLKQIRAELVREGQAR